MTSLQCVKGMFHELHTRTRAHAPQVLKAQGNNVSAELLPIYENVSIGTLSIILITARAGGFQVQQVNKGDARHFEL